MEEGTETAPWIDQPPHCANCPWWLPMPRAADVGRCSASGLRRDWTTEARYVCPAHPDLVRARALSAYD